jgi:hypothetical protein
VVWGAGAIGLLSPPPRPTPPYPNTAAPPNLAPLAYASSCCHRGPNAVLARYWPGWRPVSGSRIPDLRLVLPHWLQRRFVAGLAGLRPVSGSGIPDPRLAWPTAAASSGLLAGREWARRRRDRVIAPPPLYAAASTIRYVNSASPRHPVTPPPRHAVTPSCRHPVLSLPPAGGRESWTSVLFLSIIPARGSPFTEGAGDVARHRP